MKCEECGAALTVQREMQPITHLDTSLGHYKFALCWFVEAPVSCEKCGTPISIETWEQSLPVQIPISEGAKLMSSRNPNRYDKKRGTDSANKMWASRKGEEIPFIND